MIEKLSGLYLDLLVEFVLKALFELGLSLFPLFENFRDIHLTGDLSGDLLVIGKYKTDLSVGLLRKSGGDGLGRLVGKCILDTDGLGLGKVVIP